ncbi:MAG: hypothetical protein KBS59_03470, partial [Clostridiales bacterium]|nr:hypothetical protein [Clostridiales bacterium]
MARKKTNEYDDVGYDIDDSVKEKGEKKNTRREKTENSRQSRGYERAEKPKKEKRDGGTLSVQIKTALLCLIALFFILCFIFSGTGNTDVVGIAGNFAAEFFYGILGISAITIPLFLIGGALHLKRDTENGTVVPAVIFSVLSVLLVSVLFHTVSCIFARANPSVICKGADTFFDGHTFAKGLGALYAAGKERIGGGLIGGFLSVAMMKLIGKAGAIILSLIFLLIFILFLFGATPATLWSRVKFYIIRLSEKRASGAKKESGNERKKTHQRSAHS